MPFIQGAAGSVTEQITNKSIRRIGVVVKLYKPAAAPADVLPNLQSVIIKLSLKRNGNTHIIFNDNLAVLLRESMFHQSYDAVSDISGLLNIGTNGGDTIQAVCGMIDLGGTINCMNTDVLTFTADTNASWVDATYDASQSNIEFEIRDDIGVEKFIPKILSESINNGESRFRRSLGDNVTQVSFINTDVSAWIPLTTDIAVEHFTLTSDKYNISDDKYQMYARRNSQFESVSSSNSRKKSFAYTPNTEIDNVQIDLQLDPAQITGSANRIVYRTFVADKSTLVRGEHLEQKHEQRDGKKLAEQLQSK